MLLAVLFSISYIFIFSSYFKHQIGSTRSCIVLEGTQEKQRQKKKMEKESTRKACKSDRKFECGFYCLALKKNYKRFINKIFDKEHSALKLLLV